MIRRASASLNAESSLAKSSGCATPSPCGQSDPNRIRSTPIRSASARRSSSRYGVVQTCRRTVSSGSSWNAEGVWFASLRRRFTSRCSQSEPFSMLATRSFGWRWNTPCDDQARHRVVDRAVRDDEAAERVHAAERLERRRCAPRARERVVSAVAEVERDGDARLGEARPHRVVALVAERPARAVGRRNRGRADVHDARAALEQRVHLGERGFRDRPATASARRSGDRDRRSPSPLRASG